MNKNIVNRYNEMVSTIEDANIYDGRGVYNLYQCDKCDSFKMTLYGDKGVTPFMIGCKCGGMMTHTKTYKSISERVGFIKWVRPTLEQTLKLPEGMIEHVLNGGLVLESDLK